MELSLLIGAGAATIALAGAAVGIGNVFSSLIHSVAAILYISVSSKKISALMPARALILGVCMGQIFLSLILSKIAVSLGYVLMEDLSRAVAQFYPSTSGGMSGFPGTPSGPSGNFGQELFSSSVLNSDGQEKGSPSLSEEFPILRQTTQEIKEMVSSFEELSEPFLSLEQRQQELSCLMNRHVSNELLSSFDDTLLQEQTKLELKVEETLRSEGYSQSSIFNCREKLRDAYLISDTNPRPLGIKAIRAALEKADIRQSLCFRRIQNRIRLGVINLTKT